MNAKMRWGILYLLRQVAKDNGTDDGLMTGMSASSLQLLTQSLGSAGLHVVQPGGARPGSQASGGIGKQPPYTVHLPPSSSSSRVFQVSGILASVTDCTCMNVCVRSRGETSSLTTPS